jgi:hypothetical protein
MGYDPKIYIRDYGVPDRGYLVYAAHVAVEFNQTDYLRDLLVRIDDVVGGSAGILLSGDAQSGSDVLLLSGAEGKLFLSSPSTIMRIITYDIEFLTGVFFEPDTMGLVVAGQDIDWLRDLVSSVAPTTIDVAFRNASFLRDLLVAPDSEAATVTFSDIEFIVSSSLILSGDAQTGGDALLLSGDAQTGSDVLLLSTS